MRFVSLRHHGSPFVPYVQTWELQKRLVEKVAAGEAPNTVLYVEHESVITRGRGLQWKPSVGEGSERERHAPNPIFLPGAAPIPIVDIDRGGDLTWHGPGQLVVYPIVKLDGREGPERDVEKALRGFESAVIDVLQNYGLRAYVKKHEAGVWVDEARKIASLGIGVRKWTTFHGLALNVTNGMEAFASFNPCGFTPETMTSIRALASLGDDWRERMEGEFSRAFAKVFPVDTHELSAENCSRGTADVQEIDAF